MTKIVFNRFVLLLMAAGFWQCAGSGENPGLTGRLYHNLTAHYNAYFLGYTRLAEVEAKIVEASPSDYNRVLALFPSTDTTITGPFRPQLEEVIKKASFAIKKHPQSRWTDDSYILVGRARYYLGDFDEAIKNFRFVNTLSQTDQTRYLAQIWLMRAFVAANDYESADAVSDALKKVELNKSNARELFLNRANYALRQKNPQLAIDNLTLAVPLIENKDYQNRTQFILAQLYQEAGQDKAAYELYTHILKHNPPYELSFYSKLGLGQVTELAGANDKARIEKYYHKLLKDAKNVDFKDKIYYEMARFALKQQQHEPALTYLRQAVRASTTNETQKAYAYLLAGKIYYENLQKYPLAAAYYDSAVQILPPASTEYAATAERRDVLKAFAAQYTVVQTQDSLQALAKLDTASLNKRLTAIITAAAEKQKALEEQQKRQADEQANQNPAGNNPALTNLNGNNRNQAGADLTASNSPGGAWYFDNPASVSRARAEFQRRWGNRKLQDNWRISNQAAAPLAQNPVNAGGLTPVAGAANNGNAPAAPATGASARQALLQDIPLSPDKLRASNEQVEQALFTLATIYQQQLNEPVRAAEIYEKLLQRFPATKHRAEVYYSLYLIYQQQKNERANLYRDQIKKEFPDTKYAKLIEQPDYLKRVSENNQKARQLYDSAFSSYRHRRYTQAFALVNQVQKSYPDNELTDRIAFLEVLLAGRTQKPAAFKESIQKFFRKYPESSLLPKAQELLAAFEAFENGKLSEAEFNKTHTQTAQIPDQPEAAEPALVVEDSPVETERPNPPPRRARPLRNRGKDADLAAAETEPDTNAETETAPEDPIAAEPANDPDPAETVEAPTNTPAPVAAPPVGAPSAGTSTGTPAGNPAAPATAVKSPYAANLALPHVVVVAYPKTSPAFRDIFAKMTAYNNRYNQSEKLTLDSAALNATHDMLVIKQFATGKQAANYATKQKGPQSPLSKIRGIDFVTFAISAENLPILLKEGKLADYLTFYKTSYF